MEINNRERILKDRILTYFKGLVIVGLGIFIIIQGFIGFHGALWFLGLLFGGIFYYIGGVLMNSKYEDIQCKCGKEIKTPNDLTIVFCQHCKEKIKLIRDN